MRGRVVTHVLRGRRGISGRSGFHPGLLPGKDPGGNQARTELNILARHDDEEATNLLNSRINNNQGQGLTVFQADGPDVFRRSGTIAAGALIGFSLQFLEKYLSTIATPETISSPAITARVIILGLVIVFVLIRPSGLFVTKERTYD